MNYNELKKLMIDRDASGQGRINYTDFSKWLGNTIHLPQGFYFRHDSVKNPEYDMNLEKDAKNKQEDKKAAAQALVPPDVEDQI